MRSSAASVMVTVPLWAVDRRDALDRWPASCPPTVVMRHAGSELVIDCASGRAIAFGSQLGLSRPEFVILEHLVLHAGRAVSSDELAAVVSPPDRPVNGTTVRVHIHRVRQVLGEPFSRCLRTVRGVGYVWTNLA